MRDTERAWLDETDLGLYVLCPEAAVAEWTGEESEELYGEYAAALPVPRHGDTVVLAGLAMPVRWLAEDRVFVRSYSASDEALPDVAELLRSGAWVDGPVVELTAGRYLLADVLYEGERILATGDYLTVEVPPGRYLVQSLNDEVDELGEFFLERLLPLR
ncbi:hypothetical protein ACIPLC_29315 [Kitasatospora sp. NPDC086801]|uniref:hypothetical protein n=1 Tax=Kitasatospora sp. NPDC086801 TaxID=3364066 RepID=UPI003803454E